MSRTQLEWGSEQVLEFLHEEFPQAFSGGKKYAATKLETGHLSLDYFAGERQLRPGGTVSGPAQLELADFAVYFLLLAHHGSDARLCVTTNLTCSFLRKPQPGRLICETNLIKHGRTLTVADVVIKAENANIVSHLELTYYTGALTE